MQIERGRLHWQPRKRNFSLLATCMNLPQRRQLNGIGSKKARDKYKYHALNANQEQGTTGTEKITTSISSGVAVRSLTTYLEELSILESVGLLQ